MSEKINWFEKAKTFPLKEYIERFVPLNRRGNSCCPFHEDNPKSPSFSIKEADQYFQCFSSSCGKSGDIIKFAEYMFNLPPLEAAKKVCEDHGIDVNGEWSAEDKKRMEAEAKRRIASMKRAKAKDDRECERIREGLTASVSKYYNHFNKNFSNISERLKKIFPHFSFYNELCEGDHLGWCPQNDDVVIINKHKDKVYNIKTRTRKNVDGKWFGAKGASAHPFPLNLFREDSKEVFLCEGEKDALNLHCLGVNALTLGGVGNSWENYHHLLKDKDVYLFFDNDFAGYINTIKKANELRGIAREVYCILFFYLKPDAPDKYDVSDWLLDAKLLRVSADMEKPSRDDFDKKIAYATFKATPSTLRKIADKIDLPENKRQDLWIEDDIENVIASQEKVFAIWKNFAVSPKSEYGEQTITMSKMLSENVLNDSENCEKLQALLKEIDGDFMVNLKEALKLNTTILKNYSKMSRGDLYKAFLKMTKESNHSLYRDESAFYAWSGKHFLKIEEDDFKHYALSQWVYDAKVQYKSHHGQTITQLVDDLRIACESIDNKKKLQKYRAYSLANGTYIVNEFGNGKFIPEFKKDFCCTNLLDFAYNENAKCPKWQKMLDRVLPDPNEQKALQEFFGYCLSPNHNYEKFLFLYGAEGGNGKSVVLNMLAQFFGRSNVSHLQMQGLKGHELHALKDKVLNIGSEVDAAGAGEGMQYLKALTSTHDPITINPKNKNPYTLDKKSQPKMAFSGNKKPSGGIDNGVFRRMLLIRFDTKITDDEKIPDINERFVDEFDGIFNWAIAGLKRLIKQGKFTQSDKMKADIEEYKDEQNPMRVFVRDSIQPNSYSTEYKKDIYEYYCKWAKSKGHQPMANVRFFTSLREVCENYGISFEEHRDGKNQGGKRYLKGIMLIKESEEDTG